MTTCYLANKFGFVVPLNKKNEFGEDRYYTEKNIAKAYGFRDFLEADMFAKTSNLHHHYYAILSPSQMAMVSDSIKTHYIATREVFMVKVHGGDGYRITNDAREAYPFESIIAAHSFIRNLKSTWNKYVVLSPFNAETSLC